VGPSHGAGRWGQFGWENPWQNRWENRWENRCYWILEDTGTLSLDHEVIKWMERGVIFQRTNG
jgi:hypothetical protein